MTSVEETSVADLQELLQYFAKNTYKARGTEPKIELIQKKCHHLFAKDYKFSTISNRNGELCGHYPIKLVILESEAGQERDKINESANLRELFMKARFARCRSRFVVPVILYENKNICRSATLSSAAEIYGRSSYDFIFAGGESIPVEEFKSEDAAEYQGNDWALFDRIRGQDIKLLKELKVGFIFDLMVEKKKVKYGMNVTSSEKVDKANRYSDFCLCCVPYPGCEFFRDFKGKGYSADGLYFDWKQDYVDAQITIPEKLPFQLPVGIEWNRYRGWDLIMLTQNYLLLLLNFIKNGNGGTLIHCISGWDRTPLFVSLVRLSLWADKKAHKNLNAAEILYLTIAYDWFLFGHDLADRIQKGEEVFYFCFHFLKYIESDCFSMNSLQQFKDQTPSSLSSVTRTRCDSGAQFDGAILLEHWHGEGSNTSLSSCGSGSGCSDSRLSYFIGQEIPDVNQSYFNSSHSTLINGSSTPNVHSSQSPLNSSPRSFTNGCELESVVTEQSSSPLPVPRRSRKTSMNSDHRSSSSSICGSWQLVSGTGSPKGTTTVGHGISTNSLCEAIEEVSPRQQRLDNVRTLFVKIYAKVIGYPIQEGNTFSNILDHVTERIRESWSTVV